MGLIAEKERELSQKSNTAMGGHFNEHHFIMDSTKAVS
jgi:hypothetical protein